MHKYRLSDVNAREKINLRARELNVKVDELASYAHISRSTISRWTGGYNGVRLGKAILVAERLLVSLEWLFDDKQGYPPPPSAVRQSGDIRLLGLDRILPPSMTREEILEAIWDYQKARVRQGRPAEQPGGARPATEEAVTRQLREDLSRLQKPGEAPGQQRSTGSK